MLFVECMGTPYQIGHHHGTSASLQIHRTIEFYACLFLKNCKKRWPEVLEHAAVFEQTAREKWPRYHEEMRGVADGAGVGLLDIVAVNVRTEINFGLGLDGEGDAMGWTTSERMWLGQNWDWMPDQQQNLVITKITQEDKPTILQVTEAGIIGKIGFNSAGVGTLFNAIKVIGVDPTRMPAHFGLRMALESSSVEDAVRQLEEFGMASSAHILLGDRTTCLGLEFTKSTFAHVRPDKRGRVIYTNHLLGEHPGETETDTVWLKDSLTRMETMGENVGKLDAKEEPSWEEISVLFEDEQNTPFSINRIATEESESETLFSIVMDLKSKKAVLRMGRPTEVEESINLEL
ncbi:isopenicillin N acyltransferase [Pyrenophora tritici-repentis Pt-1C-BFP]|uniref:Isopenicillin N acyltransferase n=1 Tax=Pyrenophora tritici-repentis (strain Pt-1C-BFP) TaxID=426418 RepID=B2WHG4_PYRTR|nr:isopenicillin N acyltransferase [Pyrenophora tritici-repentis Pt-1C-BFP]EDU42474.1 isopenicillin N acyltransferase [Pyrenophora tritici-repentis Pt-1C-BFP]